MRKQAGWELVSSSKGPSDYILERIILRNAELNITLVADAYRGSKIRQATEDFLHYSAGNKNSSVKYKAASMQAGGAADLIVYIGHNGLMDFELNTVPSQANVKKRAVAIFACQSKKYFSAMLKKTGAEPLIWTQGNMAPEAYTLHALLEGWGRNETPENIRQKVAGAYDKYQKCGIKAARWLFSTGY